MMRSKGSAVMSVPFPLPLRERATRQRRAGRGGGQDPVNVHRDIVGPQQDLGIPEAQDRKTLFFQPRSSPWIGHTVHMLRAVGLDNQPGRKAGEVSNVRADRHLALELPRFKALGAEDRPELRLGISHAAAHRLSVIALAIGNNPSPRSAPARRVALSRKGRGKSHATNPSGFSISALNALINSAPSAPSMARWSKLPVTLITVAIASAPPTT